MISLSTSSYLNLLLKTPKLTLSPDCKSLEDPFIFDPLTNVPYLEVSLIVNVGTGTDWL